MTKSSGHMDITKSDEFEGGLFCLFSESTFLMLRNMRVTWQILSNTRENYLDNQERAYLVVYKKGKIERIGFKRHG